MTAAARKSVEEQAAAIAGLLRSIRALQRDSLVAEAHRYGPGLTGPQLSLLETVVDRLRSGTQSPSVSELSARLGLSHSTVSGIVDRLQEAGILARARCERDRRVTRIVLTGASRRWLESEMPHARERPLSAALAKASAQDRANVLDGLAILERLLQAGLGRAGA